MKNFYILILVLTVPGFVRAADVCEVDHDYSGKKHIARYATKVGDAEVSVKVDLVQISKTYSLPNSSIKSTNNMLFEISGKISASTQECEITKYISDQSASSSAQICGDVKVYVFGEWVYTTDNPNYDHQSGYVYFLHIDIDEQKASFFGNDHMVLCDIDFVENNRKPVESKTIKDSIRN